MGSKIQEFSVFIEKNIGVLELLGLIVSMSAVVILLMTLRQGHKYGIASNRPYLKITRIELEHKEGLEKPPVLEIVVFNHGNTPAVVKEISYDLVRFEGDSEKRFLIAGEPTVFKLEIPIFPDDEIALILEKPRISSLFVPQSKSKPTTWHVTGSVNYTDFFNEKRSSNFYGYSDTNQSETSSAKLTLLRPAPNHEIT